MSRLDELIKELCPNGVEYKSLSECCEVLDNKRKPVTKAAREAGKYPYYGANGIQDYVSDYIFDGTFILVGEDGSVVTENGNPVVNWAEGKIWVNNHAHIISETEGVLLRYLYHFLQTINVKPLIHGNIPKLTGGDFRALQIPVPPLEVQDEIVKILDNFTELTAELTARKQQYEYYRDNLLTFKKNDIETLTIGQLATLVTKQTGFDYSSSIKPSLKIEKSDNTIPYLQTKNFSGIQFDYNTDYYVPMEIVEKFPKITLDEKCVLFSIVGASIGNIGLFPGTTKCFLGGAICVVKFKENVNIDYVYHYMSSYHGQKMIAHKTKGAGQATVTVDDIRNMQIPLPSSEVQEKLVKVLDNFDAICSDLKIGLPAEIEARKKQYEFY
ncbi:MAG: restriction endonuclease subunit S, partial [Clostridia bacterium]|nr:restriction endonuclease subunit S [Clostridia bacterium]